MVKVRVSVRVVVWVRVLSASTYLPTDCSANLQSTFYPWPVLYGMMLAVRTYRRIHTRPKVCLVGDYTRLFGL